MKWLREQQRAVTAARRQTCLPSARHSLMGGALLPGLSHQALKKQSGVWRWGTGQGRLHQTLLAVAAAAAVVVVVVEVGQQTGLQGLPQIEPLMIAAVAVVVAAARCWKPAGCTRQAPG